MAFARPGRHPRPGNIANHPRKLCRSPGNVQIINGRAPLNRLRMGTNTIWTLNNNIWPYITFYTRAYTCTIMTVLYDFWLFGFAKRYATTILSYWKATDFKPARACTISGDVYIKIHDILARLTRNSILVLPRFSQDGLLRRNRCFFENVKKKYILIICPST